MGADHLSGWAASSMVFISAGTATAERIRAVGHLLRRAGVDVAGAIVIGSGDSDDSVGDLPWTTEVPPDEDRRPLGILQAGGS